MRHYLRKSSVEQQKASCTFFLTRILYFLPTLPCLRGRFNFDANEERLTVGLSPCHQWKKTIAYFSSLWCADHLRVNLWPWFVLPDNTDAWKDLTCEGKSRYVGHFFPVNLKGNTDQYFAGFSLSVSSDHHGLLVSLNKTLTLCQLFCYIIGGQSAESTQGRQETCVCLYIYPISGLSGYDGFMIVLFHPQDRETNYCCKRTVLFRSLGSCQDSGV